jgi:hypothetical protein
MGGVRSGDDVNRGRWVGEGTAQRILRRKVAGSEEIEQMARVG